MSSGEQQIHKKFYRYLRPFDWHQDQHTKDVRLASSAFKDSKGYSVDADGSRSNEDCVNTLFQRMKSGDPNEGIISFESQEVSTCKVDVIEKPEDDNPYHCIFVNDKSVDKKDYKLSTRSKAKCLQNIHQIEKTT
jgi:hypothetical protein